MGFFKDLFGKSVQLKDLKIALKGVERDRRRSQIELRKLSAKQAALLEQIKQKRKEGNDIEVDYIWEDLKALKTEIALARRVARRANLEGIALKRYIYVMERLNKEKDEKSVHKLLERVRNSSLDAKLSAADIKEQEYLDELQAILDDIGIADELAFSDIDDPEKAKFLAIIDDINDAEESGDLEAALKKEEELKTKLEKLEELDDMSDGATDMDTNRA